MRNIKNLLSPNDPDQSLKNVLRRLSKSNVDDYDNGYIRGAARRAQTNHLNEVRYFQKFTSHKNLFRS